jgi:hypothetical protein
MLFIRLTAVLDEQVALIRSPVAAKKANREMLTSGAHANSL